MSSVAILGAGMAGFGAAYQLHQEDIQTETFDKRSHFGGHTSSLVTDNGFTFDEGPHISFTKVERMQNLFAEFVGQEYETLTAQANNYWKGHWIKHPAQCNLYGLPADLVVKVLRDFIDAQQKLQNGVEPEIKNYEDWLLASYGETFARTFPMEYGLRYHTTTANNMTTEWLGPRLYRPDLEEVLFGALSPSTPDVHYISHFRYPAKGGFFSYLKPFSGLTQFHPGHRVTSIQPRTGEIRFAGGKVSKHEAIISSIPLPDLIPMIEGVPEDVVEAAQRLACSKCVVVNIGVDREDISPANWTYIYDQDFSFTRVSYPHMFSRNNAPPGTGSIQAELYYSDKYRPLDKTPEELIPEVIADLYRCGLLREGDKILYQGAMLLPYANIIFDLERTDALEIIHGYLDDVGIATCGRYGEWGYLWTDESFMSGEKAARKVLDRVAL